MLLSNPYILFGYGLSYTSFEYENLELVMDQVTENNEVIARVTVRNNGNFEGEEVVQVYIHDVVASRVRPVKELKGYQKVHLLPGETKVCEIHIPVKELGFHNRNLEYVIEPGEFQLWAGPISEEGLMTTFTIVDNGLLR